MNDMGKQFPAIGVYVIFSVGANSVRTLAVYFLYRLKWTQKCVRFFMPEYKYISFYICWHFQDISYLKNNEGM